MSNSLWPHGLQHTRLPCPSLSPAVCSDSCPLSQWCYLTISSSAAPFCFCLQSFPASGSFPISQLFTSKYWSFRFSNSPSNEYLVLISFRTDWFDLLVVQGTLNSLLTDLISLLSKGLSIVFSAAKSLQLCPTLCDPTDGSPPGSPVPGILQAGTLEWVTISSSNECMHAKLLQSCLTLCNPVDSS